MALADIVSHGRQREVLQRSLARDALAPAYLFFGPPGVGKMKTAMEFARALLCAAEGEDACGTCSSCRLAGGGAHPDLFVAAPEKRTLKIEQVRSIQEFLSLKPSGGGRKAALLDDADTLSTEGANALLKTLEEPPPKAVIVLVSSNPGGLPPTVISRCRRLGFGTLGEDEVAEVLRREGWSAEDSAAGAALSEGSPGAAFGTRHSNWASATKSLGDFLAAVGDGEGGKVLAAVERLPGDREEAALVLQLLLGTVRKELRGRSGLGTPVAPELPACLRDLDRDGLLALAERLVGARRRLDENVNVKLALGSFFGQWTRRAGCPSGPEKRTGR